MLGSNGNNHRSPCNYQGRRSAIHHNFAVRNKILSNLKACGTLFGFTKVDFIVEVPVFERNRWVSGGHSL